jgi:hypothetical protein
MDRTNKLVAATLMAAAASWLAAPASAAPMSPPPGLHSAVAAPIETVQYRRGYRGGYRGGYYGRGFGGAGIGLGVAAGAIIGGAILGATQPYGYYGYGPGYVYAPAYGPGYYDGAPNVDGNAVAYCQQRFRSYDPASGTYLGLDGYRHNCP